MRTVPDSEANLLKVDRIELVDYARFASALAVVGFHYLFNGVNGGKVTSIGLSPPVSTVAQYGFFGVDMFFLISGFVIANSAAGRSASRFAVGRVHRLYPTFWAALIITTVFTLVFSPRFTRVSPGEFAANLTMVPNIFGAEFVDGVYWTLGYELTFYVAVFVLMVVGLGRWLDDIFTVWLMCTSVLTALLPSVANVAPLAGGYFVFFGTGAVISAIRRKGWSATRAVALCFGVVAAMLFDNEYARHHGLHQSVVMVITAAIVGVLLVTLWAPAARIRLPGSKLAGQLTYPLYLVHAYIGYMLIGAFATDDNKVWVLPAVVVFVIMLALALHYLVERRMKNVWFVGIDRTVGSGIRMLEQSVDRVTRSLRRGTPSPGTTGSAKLFANEE